MRKTTTGWLRPLANFNRSSWVNAPDGSGEKMVAGFPANAFTIANGYVLGVDAVYGVGDPEPIYCTLATTPASFCHHSIQFQFSLLTEPAGVVVGVQYCPTVAGMCDPAPSHR